MSNSKNASWEYIPDYTRTIDKNKEENSKKMDLANQEGKELEPGHLGPYVFVSRLVQSWDKERKLVLTERTHVGKIKNYNNETQMAQVVDVNGYMDFNEENKYRNLHKLTCHVTGRKTHYKDSYLIKPNPL